MSSTNVTFISVILTAHKSVSLVVVLLRSSTSSGCGSSSRANALKQLRRINQSHPAAEREAMTFDSLLWRRTKHVCALRFNCAVSISAVRPSLFPRPDWQLKIGYVKYFICYSGWHLLACTLCQYCWRARQLYERALYTECGFCAMSQSFSWHNLRYIKKRCRHLSTSQRCLMPILLSSDGRACMLIIEMPSTLPSVTISGLMFRH